MTSRSRVPGRLDANAMAALAHPEIKHRPESPQALTREATKLIRARLTLGGGLAGLRCWLDYSGRDSTRASD